MGIHRPGSPASLNVTSRILDLGISSCIHPYFENYSKKYINILFELSK
jgi:hypothetical protein